MTGKISDKFQSVTSKFVAKFFLSVLILSSCALAQIRILQPPELVTKFRLGLIRGSTAGFGTPYWGEQLVGKLVYAESRGAAYCSENDYDLPPLPPPAMEEDVPNYSRIVVVRRGQCHFSTKVKVAQDFKNAAAVIVVDEPGSKRTPADIRGVIMADDGLGATIRIPSVLISDREGSELISLLRQDRDIIVEMTWDIPNEYIVDIDHWLSPGTSATINFLGAFAGFAKAMRHQLNFKPHFWIFSLPTDTNSMCRDLNGRFCGLAPDWHDEAITGKDIVEESLRQRCLWEMTKSTNSSLPHSGEFSPAWWDYIEALDNACLRPRPDSATFAFRGTAECSFGLMKKLGIDVPVIQECVETYGDSFLLSDLYSHAWSPTAMMINDARFAGPLDPFVVARAVCTGFVREPPECQALRSKPIHDVLFGDDRPGYVLGESLSRTKGGVAWWVYFLSVLASILLCVSVVGFYKIWLVKELRNRLRYEVFEEVKSQIGLHNASTNTRDDTISIQSSASGISASDFGSVQRSQTQQSLEVVSVGVYH